MGYGPRFVQLFLQLLQAKFVEIYGGAANNQGEFCFRNSVTPLVK